MCSRFELKPEARLGLKIPPGMPEGAAFRPTDPCLVLGGAGGPALLRWGMRVNWDAKPLINARMETLSEKPIFRRILNRRALVPASAWWEWNPDKLKLRLHRRDDALMGFAALVDEHDCFVIITRPAVAAPASVHDRMPAPAGRDWLRGADLPEPGDDFVAELDRPPRPPDLFD